MQQTTKPSEHAAATAKPKRPRHFHEGTQPVEDDEEQNKSSVPSAPISRLYPAVLSVIFNCLTLSELHPVLSVSRSWLASIRRMPFFLRSRFFAISPPLLASVVSSPLGRQIGHTSAKLISNEMCTLALGMPQLLTMQCEVVPSDAQKMILPSKLEALELNLSALDAVGFNRAAEAIGQLTALLNLTLTFSLYLPEMSFAPLSKCPALAKLTIKVPPEVKRSTQPSDAHIDQLRALSHLRCVAIPDVNNSSLAKLLRSPHSLQWTDMAVASFDSASAAALRNLPGMLTLDTWNCRDVSFLPVMTLLQSLELEIAANPWAISAEMAVEAISSCRQITSLNIIAPFASAHLSVLLPRLAQLRVLILVFCDELESLLFLSDVPALHTSLLVFKLHKCSHPALRSAELRHVVTLKELTKLELKQSFADPLDGFTLHQLTPPSSVLPKLATFAYIPPASAAAVP